MISGNKFLLDKEIALGDGRRMASGYVENGLTRGVVFE